MEEHPETRYLGLEANIFTEMKSCMEARAKEK